MAEQSGISWTDATFNPWMGCTKVSPACRGCYAEREMDHRYNRVAWGPMGTRVMTSPDNWKNPIKWNRLAGEGKCIGCGGKGCRGAVLCKVCDGLGVLNHRPRVFCASLADVFEDWTGAIMDHQGNQLWIGPDRTLTSEPGGKTASMADVRAKLFALIDATPNLDWLILTKRPENVRRLGFGDKAGCVCGEPPSHGGGSSWDCRKCGRANNRWARDNVWLGTSVENQEYADKRIPELLKCCDLSPVLFLSCEPLLGPVELGLKSEAWKRRRVEYWKEQPIPEIDWVIAGGESGQEARPSHPNWFRSLRDQCSAAGVPFHFKQWGEFAYSQARGATWEGTDELVPASAHPVRYDRVGVKAAGRLLDGVLHDAFPEAQPCG